MSADTIRERHVLDQVTRRLSRSFAEEYSPAQVDEKVSSVHHRFDDSPIRDFVPVLVERIARDELRHAAPDRPLRTPVRERDELSGSGSS